MVKHVLTQNFIQKPETYQNRPVKQPSMYGAAQSAYQSSPAYSGQKSFGGGKAGPAAGKFGGGNQLQTSKPKAEELQKKLAMQ